MANIPATSQSDLAQINDLLDKKTPSYRQAYSDRTAWLMAYLSDLAYIKFDPLFSDNNLKERLFDRLNRIIALADDNRKSYLKKIIDKVGYDHDEERKRLNNELEILRWQLLETFDSNGTQAILASNDEFMVLAFRGTESDVMEDIKTDMEAGTTLCETGGKMHTGFKEAFEAVELDIQSCINKEKYKDKPLFITGHSLGGALATIAAKELTHKGGIAACYTFGSPRVGDDEWIADIRNPVYRVVNAADCVTMLPPGATLMTIVCGIAKCIPYIGETVRAFLSKYGGYLHCGDMRYLTNCQKGAYSDVKLLSYVSFFYRIKGLWIKKRSWRKFLSDHSISVYRKKLMIIAERRNLK